jgi:hypothetical protein
MGDASIAQFASRLASASLQGASHFPAAMPGIRRNDRIECQQRFTSHCLRLSRKQCALSITEANALARQPPSAADSQLEDTK